MIILISLLSNEYYDLMMSHENSDEIKTDESISELSFVLKQWLFHSVDARVEKYENKSEEQKKSLDF